MRGLGRGGNHDRVNGRIFEQTAIIRRGSDRVGLRRDFFQPFFPDLRDMQFAHKRARGTGLRAYTTAPPRADDSDAYFFHGASSRPDQLILSVVAILT